MDVRKCVLNQPLKEYVELFLRGVIIQGKFVIVKIQCVFIKLDPEENCFISKYYAINPSCAVKVTAN